MSNAGTTTAEGHVVDLACVRRYPENEYEQRATRHTTSCALMGHCVDSGYGLISDDGTLHVLAPTPPPSSSPLSTTAAVSEASISSLIGASKTERW